MPVPLAYSLFQRLGCSGVETNASAPFSAAALTPAMSIWPAASIVSGVQTDALGAREETEILFVLAHAPPHPTLPCRRQRACLTPPPGAAL